MTGQGGAFYICNPPAYSIRVCIVLCKNATCRLYSAAVSICIMALIRWGDKEPIPMLYLLIIESMPKVGSDRSLCVKGSNHRRGELSVKCI